MRDELLGYYERELIFLRRMGADFARKYPKIASRLLLDEEKIEDPHVERMVEAFAFLSARIGLKLDDELPEITEAFLNLLYPHYLAPIPSMAIAELTFGQPNEKLSTIQYLPSGTQFSSRPVDGTPCRFRSAYDVSLVPVAVQSAALESPAPKDGRGMYSESVIRLSMRCHGGANLHEMKAADPQAKADSLRFYLDGDPQLVYPLYEIIFNHAEYVEFVPKEAPLDGSMTMFTNVRTAAPDPIRIPAAEALKPVGFAESEAMLPFSKRSFSGYRLLTEYFSFPYKFLFVDIHGLDRAIEAQFGSDFDIVIHLKDIVPPIAPITADTFRLSCTPIINLFSRLCDPVYVSQKKFEYQILPDVHRQSATEIYSIDEVFSTDPRTNAHREFSPFYSMRHAYGEQMEKSFWYGSRKASQRPDDDGTEMFVTLVDSNFNPRVPAIEVLNVRATCSNRDLPGKLAFGGADSDFVIEGTALVSRIRCLTKPTDTIRPPQRRSLQWRLISHLNLNYLSLVNGESGTPLALQEILQLYNFNDSSVTRKQILGIVGIETRKLVRRMGDQIGAGFVRGFETTLTFDEEQYVGSGMYLFAQVLERFLGLYSSLNSFNQLVVRTTQREETVKIFPPRAGEQELI
jgi:type VI secretion system protein ImpG